MVATDAIEGVVDSTLWFHYDLGNDVLYLRVLKDRETATYADEQDEGMLLLRAQDSDEPVGLTIINWWKHYGNGSLPDSLKVLETKIEPFAKRLAA